VKGSAVRICFPYDSLHFDVTGIEGDLHAVLPDNDMLPGDPDDSSIKHYDVAP
jgi:hypothetical protein